MFDQKQFVKLHRHGAARERCSIGCGESVGGLWNDREAQESSHLYFGLFPFLLPLSTGHHFLPSRAELSSPFSLLVLSPWKEAAPIPFPCPFSHWISKRQDSGQPKLTPENHRDGVEGILFLVFHIRLSGEAEWPLQIEKQDEAGTCTDGEGSTGGGGPGCGAGVDLHSSSSPVLVLQ